MPRSLAVYGGLAAVVVAVVVAVVIVLLSGPDSPSPAAPTPTSTLATVAPTPTPTVPANRAPELASIGDQTVALGSSLALQLSASDPEGEAVSFGVSPLPLVQNASLNVRSGSFVFRPDGAQVGTFELTFLVSDGEGGTDSETVTITVEAPPPGGVTALVGRILDANDFVNGTETPVVGATVSLLGVGASTVSDADGRFALTGIPGDSQVFDIDATTASEAPDGSPYAGFRESIKLIPDASNVVDRPFFLPRIAVESLTPVDPSSTTLVMNESLGVMLTIPPNTAKVADGSNFTGELSISLVPEALAPAALPEDLEPGMLITLQPVGVTFATPVPITFPNIDNLVPGSETDLWSLDPEAGTFVVVGTGRVSADGSVIETISGGIRANDWHAALPPSGSGDGGRNNSTSQSCGCPALQRVTGSKTAMRTGNLSVDHSLATYWSLNTAVGLRLVYNSLNAEPWPIISSATTISLRAAVPPTVSASLTVAGLDQGVETFTDTSGLDENRDEIILQAVQFDASGYETGAYPYSLRLTSNYPSSSISSRLPGHVLVNNQQRSPLGAGWTLDGLERLHIQDTVVMATRGDGSALTFDVVPDAFLLDSFEGGASEFWTDRTTTANADAFTEFLGRFGSQTVSLTLSNLPPHTGIEVHFDFYAIDSWDGTDPSFGGPDQFLVGHGESLDNLFIEDFVFPGRGSPEQSYTTTEPEISVNLGFNSWADAVYRDLNNGFAFLHREDAVTLNFTGRGLQALSDESWGIDNVTIILTGGPTKLPTYLSPSGDFSQLVQHNDGTFTRTLRDGTRIGFDSQGFQTSVVDRNDNTTEYVYDGQGRLVSITDPVGLVTRFTYDSHLTGITDPAGRTTRFEHDGRGNLVRVTDPDGTSRQFAYDARHHLTSQTSKKGLVTTYAYDFAGRNVQTMLPDGSTRAASAAQTAGIVDLARGLGAEASAAPVTRPGEGGATFTDGNGNTSVYKTNKFGSATERADPLGRTRMVSYDSDNRPARVVNPNGAVTVMEYDARGNLLSTVEAQGQGEERFNQIEYEAVFNQVTSFTDAGSNTWKIDYDTRGNPVRVGNPLGGARAMTYDGRGLLLTLTDENGNTTTFDYDAKGNLSSVTDAEGNATTLTRDAAGNVTTIREGVGGPEERTTSFTYDPLNRLVTLTDGTGATTRFRYDERGNVVEIENAVGEVTSLGYDARDRVIRIDNPADGPTSFTYDANDNVVESVDGLGAVTRFEYDAADQLVESTDALGGVQRYGYDDMGNLVSLQDPLGQTTTFKYDLLNRLVERTDPLGLSSTFVYDSRNNVVTSTDARGQVMRLTYDGLSRLTQIKLPDDTVTYEYDDVANLLAVEDGDSLLSFVYDGLNRPTQAQTMDRGRQPATTLTYSYDAVGNRLQLNDSEGGVTRAEYDAVGRLTQLITPARDTIGLGYDPAGRLSELLFPNGVVSRYQYDPQGRLGAIGHTGAAGAALASFGYTYDGVGRIITITEPTQTRGFTYDALGQVIGGGAPATPETYAYDALGNRTTSFLSAAHVQDDSNRLLADDHFIYAYDESGNLTTKTSKVDQTTTTFDFDGLNRLVRITFPDGSRADYRYDGLGRRIEKDVDGAVTRYVYDGADILLEFDTTNTLVARYSHGDRVDQPLSMERGGARYFYHADHLRSIRELTDSTGAVVNRYDYDAFGRPGDTVQGVVNPFTYTGREHDAESGLLYYRARYYDPQIGRFISSDPLGIAAGDLNLYRYVGNNPVGKIDPSGLENGGSELLKLFGVSKDKAKTIKEISDSLKKTRKKPTATNLLDLAGKFKGSSPVTQHPGVNTFKAMLNLGMGEGADEVTKSLDAIGRTIGGEECDVVGTTQRSGNKVKELATKGIVDGFKKDVANAVTGGAKKVAEDVVGKEGTSFFDVVLGIIKGIGSLFGFGDDSSGGSKK